METAELFVIFKAEGGPMFSDFYSSEQAETHLKDCRILLRYEIPNDPNREWLTPFMDMPLDLDNLDDHESLGFFVGLQATEHFKKGFKLGKINPEASIPDVLSLEGLEELVDSQIATLEEVEELIIDVLEFVESELSDENEEYEELNQEVVDMDELEFMKKEGAPQIFLNWVKILIKKIIESAYRAGFELAKSEPDFQFDDGPAPFDAEALQQELPLDILLNGRPNNNDWRELPYADNTAQTKRVLSARETSQFFIKIKPRINKIFLLK